MHDGCQICCSDAQCLTDSISLINAASSANVNHAQLHCPADCTLDNLAACVSSGHVCNDHQYCKVSVDETNGHMHGKCEERRDIQHCTDEVADQKCDPRHHNCIVGCCTDDQCVAGTFGSNETSLFEFLKNGCADQLADNQCAGLDASQHLCADHLALRVCPQTCGLCTVYNSFDCKDIVLNNGCQGLVTSEDVCNNPLGKFLCPVTCKMCDSLIDEAIKEALLNNQNGSTSTGGSQDVTCTALAGEDCSVLATVCPMVNCPEACSRCSSPVMTAAPASTIVPDVTDMPTDVTVAPSVGVTGDGLSALTCESLQGQGCGVLDAVCQQVNCPDVCDPCFNPIVTVPQSTMAPPASMVPAVSTTGAVADSTDACVDTIQEMQCSDVTDVCSSPLLVNYCQKYCGLC